MLSVLSVALVHCGQTVGRIKIKHGTHVGLSPGHIMLHGTIDREFVTSAKKSRILTNFPKLKKFVKKFVKCPSVGLPRVPGYPSGTRVINYPGNFLLPDGTGTA